MLYKMPFYKLRGAKCGWRGRVGVDHVFDGGMLLPPSAPLACLRIKGCPPSLPPASNGGYKMSIYPRHRNDSSAVPLIW